MNTKDIKSQMNAFMSRVVIIMVLVFVLVGGSLASFFMMKKEINLTESRTDAVVQGTTGWYDAQIARVNLITESLTEGGFTDEKIGEAQDFLANAIKENPAAYDYYFGLEDTTCVFGGGWEPAPGEYDPTTREWYIESKKIDGAYVSAAYVDADSGRVVITISKALRKDGEVVGVFAADFFTDELTEMSDALATKTSFPILIDNAGVVLTHKNENYIPSTDADGEMIAHTYSEIGISDKLYQTSERSKKLGLRYIYTSEYIAEAGTTIVYATSFGEFFGALILFYAICFILLIIAFVVCRARMRSMLTKLFAPLGELSEVADNMTNGILDYSATYTNQDEIGDLCVAIEESNAAIRSYIDDIGEKLAMMSEGDFTVNVDMDYIGNFASLKDSINGIADSLRDAMVVIAEAADAVHRSAENVAGGAGSLAGDVENVGNIVSDVDRQIEAIQQGFGRSLEIVRESLDLSSSAKDYLDASYEQITHLTEAMDEITEKSNSIAEIINIINGIAAQTNLLALNASIEAARAGEAGRGFAVVADSVRELADQTSKAAADTTALINESTEAVERGSILVDKATASMKHVVELTEDVNSHVSEIASNIDEEAEMVSKVSENMKYMEDYANNTQATSQECVALSDELYEQVNLMHEKIGGFKL